MCENACVVCFFVCVFVMLRLLRFVLNCFFAVCVCVFCWRRVGTLQKAHQTLWSWAATIPVVDGQNT